MKIKVKTTGRRGMPVPLGRLKAAVKRTFAAEGMEGEDTEVSILFCGDKKMRGLNEKYLGRKGTTDVISFPMRDGMFSRIHPEILGDIAVNIQQAKRAGAPFEREVLLYVVHGLLHLLGYTDNGEAEARNMHKRCMDILGEKRYAC